MRPSLALELAASPPGRRPIKPSFWCRHPDTPLPGREFTSPVSPPRASAAPVRLVPDTSVVVDGRISRLLDDGEYGSVELLVPVAVLAELEAQANRGIDAGYNGLDELVSLQGRIAKGKLSVRFVGRRPNPDEVDLAEEGAIGALIREVAEAEDATLITGDKVQAQVCEAMGVGCRYLRAENEAAEIEELGVVQYFDEETMSVHLKQEVVPHVKRGRPGEKTYEALGTEPLTKAQLNEMAREIIEAGRRDDRSFVEIERHGATVVQLRNMRIAISRPPFSDAIEITAVRPVAHLTLDDYDLPDMVRERIMDYSRGVFVSGPPGSGKSTFAQAVATYLHEQGTVVKTMESPRDLQVPDAVTQYAPLERDIELTGDFLLLVRPDFVVYDEVRKTRDFEVFADMRLAGVGLMGVTHANRAIDAVQRLIGRVELGMIPQIVDTVVHIVKGEIQQILEMDFTVRVPSGMTEADLARPVIRVRDFQTKSELFEIYTYGEQVVVMPMQEAGESTGVQRLAEEELARIMSRQIEGEFEIRMSGSDRAAIYVEDWEIASVIGRGGSRVQDLQRKTGLKLDIKTFSDLKRAGGSRTEHAGRAGPNREFERLDMGDGREVESIIPRLRLLKKSIVLAVPPEHGGRQVEILVNGQSVASGHLSHKAEMRFNSKGPEAKRLAQAKKHGDEIVCVFH